MKFQTILFDFDGVLCHDRFYGADLKSFSKEAYAWVQTHIFGEDHSLANDWMRGKVTSAEINKKISGHVGVDHNKLDKILEKSVRQMKLDEQVQNLAKKLKKQGYKIGLVTDNMDVFSNITVSNHKLDKLFHCVINSSDYGCLKRDAGGKLFDIAIAVLGGNIENSLMIDDSVTKTALYAEKGGIGFLYKNFEELEAFLGLK